MTMRWMRHLRWQQTVSAMLALGALAAVSSAARAAEEDSNPKFEVEFRARHGHAADFGTQEGAGQATFAVPANEIVTGLVNGMVGDTPNKQSGGARTRSADITIAPQRPRSGG